MISNGVRPHTVAFMDFGTNSVRLLVVRIEPNQAYTVLQALKETVRLGEGEFSRHLLQPQAMERALAAAGRFAEVARSADAEEIIAVGTAAIREAENRAVFTSRLLEEHGINLHVISGREEARLINLGVTGGIDLGLWQAFFIDIGGGSTETSIGKQQEALYLNSLKLGAIRVSGQFAPGPTGVISPALYARMKEHVLNESSRSLAEMRQFRLDLAIGSSGTIENLADVCIRAFRGRQRLPEDVLTLGELARGVRMLCQMTLEERKAAPGINPSRADIIIGGAAILETLMEMLNLDEIRISERGLRDGLLHDYLARHGHADVASEVPLRMRSVLQLGRACRFNEEHARQTASLAVRLFDTAKTAGLHQMGEPERELLEYAALLHHIGSFLTYSGYHKHSRYLVRNAELLGFDEYETTVMSLIIQYHRGALVDKRDTEMMSLSEVDRHSILVLATLLRIAENLDRGQASTVSDAQILPQGEDRIVIDIQAVKDCHVEITGLESQREVIRRVFKRRLRHRLEQVAS
jgi:exopolyphosphatase/guanosine-5'-triphosphate,3'-diphosphate pyrophosphatase